MTDPKDAQFDERDPQIAVLIRRHVSSALEPHVGGASRRFAEHLAAESRAQAQRMKISSSSAPARKVREPGPRFGSFWSIGLVGTALAATLTIVSMRDTTVKPMLNPGSTGDVGPQQVALKEADWRTDYQGLVRMPDGSLARKYLNSRTDTITWYDPKTKTTYEYQQPQEETLLVGLRQH